MIRFLWVVFCLLPSIGYGAEKKVIDLGKYQVQGTMRGPEVQFIDSDRLSDSATGNLFQNRVKSLEKEALQPEPPLKFEAKKR